MLNSISRHLVAGLAFLQLAHAVPSSLATRSTTRYKATFEDITIVDPTLSIQPINEYKEAFFNSFVLVNTDSKGLIQALPVVGGAAGSLTNVGLGVTPHSPPRCAAFSVVTRTEQGTPSLTTVYAGSSANKRITLFSFWWGAILRTQEAIASLPQNAQLTVTGLDANEKPVAVDRFDYDVTGAKQQMVFAKLNSTFTNLKHVDFFIDGIAAGIAISTLFDDFDFSVTL
ncbi:hypothetical protein MMC22_004789 [Lobaria immixta]|nr:hypothetical protein [Lobaria immixta]